MNAKRALIDEQGDKLPSKRRQCELIGLNRSSLYAQPQTSESEENLTLMRRIDEIYTAHPFYGSRKITAALVREGQRINRKRVYRLMDLMGLQSIAPKPNTSKKHPQHKVYPYFDKLSTSTCCEASKSSVSTKYGQPTSPIFG